MIELCDIKDLDHASAREFKHDGRSVFVLNWQGEYFAYLNHCPHAGWPLNFLPDGFFNADKTLLQCSNHMAMFRPETGECISGPCGGSYLTPIPLTLMETTICIELD